MLTKSNHEKYIETTINNMGTAKWLRNLKFTFAYKNWGSHVLDKTWDLLQLQQMATGGEEPVLFELQYWNL